MLKFRAWRTRLFFSFIYSSIVFFFYAVIGHTQTNNNIRAETSESVTETCASSEDSRSLIRIFTGRIYVSKRCKVFFSNGQRRPRSDCEDGQAVLIFVRRPFQKIRSLTLQPMVFLQKYLSALLYQIIAIPFRSFDQTTKLCSNKEYMSCLNIFYVSGLVHITLR